MAIKLEIPQTSQSNMNYTGSAVSMRSDRNFGNMVADPMQLPRANASGRFQSDMAVADSIGDGYRVAARAMSDISNQIWGHVQAADENAGNNVYLGLKSKHSEIHAKNLERVNNREINVMDLPEENRKMFLEEARTQIENAPVTLNSTRDKLSRLAEELSINQFDNDIKFAIAKNTEDMKRDFMSNRSALVNQASNSIADLQRVEQELNVMRNTHKVAISLAGPNVWERMDYEDLQKQTRILLDNTIKSNPYKAKELWDSGALDVAKKFLPESEWGVFEKEIADQQRNNEIKTLQDDNRRSSDWAANSLLRIHTGDIPTEESILNSDAQPDDKLRVLTARREVVKKQEAEFADYKDLTEEISRVGGTGLTTEKMNKLFLLSDGGETLKTLREQPEKAYIITNQLIAKFGRIPESVITTINAGPVNGKEKEWAESVRNIVSTYPEQTKDISETNKHIAFIMNERSGTDMPNISYDEARKRLQERTAEYETNKTNPRDGKNLPSEKETKDFLTSSDGTDMADIPVGLTNDWREKYSRLSALHPDMDPKQLQKMALEEIGWKKTTIGNARYMKLAPETVYKDPVELDTFKRVVETYANDKGIKSYTLIPNPDGKSFKMVNYDKSITGVLEPQTFIADPKVLEIRQFEESKQPGFRFGVRKTEYAPKLEKAQNEIARLQNRPGLFQAIAAVESGFNPDAVNPDGGAFGLFQFVTSTAKKYGLKKGDNVNQQIEAMTRYWNDLMDRYNGSVIRSLREYRGYYTLKEKYGQDKADEIFNDYLAKLKKNGFDVNKEGNA